MSRVLLRLSAFSVVLLILSGQGCPPPAEGNDNEDVDAVVNIRSLSFDPPSVTIEVGQTVRWVNQSILVHTATSGNPEDPDSGEIFDSGLMARGGRFDFTFTEAGTYVYHCITHPLQMRDATVIVEEP